MKFLIPGGLGFLGSNLSSEVMRRQDELVIVDNFFRHGTRANLEWLNTLGKFTFYECDIRNNEAIREVFEKERPDVVFHVAGQVAMTTSLQNPRIDFEINTLGTFNILEAMKDFCPKAKIIYSSTNKVYGDLEHLTYNESEKRYHIEEFPNGLPESIPLDFRTPYGCSKGSADQYIKDFYKNYGIQSIVFRHSSIYGGRQFATIDQGWVGWFVGQAIEAKKNPKREAFTISGNGKQVRDVLYSEDLVSCYFAALENMNGAAGEVFNIGGGPGNSLSLLELFDILNDQLEIQLNYRPIDWRSSDQKVFVADISKAQKFFNFNPRVSSKEGIARMIDWVGTIQ